MSSNGASRLFLMKEIWCKQASSRTSSMIRAKKLAAPRMKKSAKIASVISHTVNGLERVHNKNLSSISILSPEKLRLPLDLMLLH